MLLAVLMFSDFLCFEILHYISGIVPSELHFDYDDLMQKLIFGLCA